MESSSTLGTSQLLFSDSFTHTSLVPSRNIGVQTDFVLLKRLHQKHNSEPFASFLRSNIAVHTDSAPVEPLAQDSFDVGSQPGLKNDHLKVLPRADEPTKLLQQRSRRTSHHPQAGNDESTSQHVTSMRNNDDDEHVSRLEDHLAIEKQQSSEYSRLDSPPLGGSSEGRTGSAGETQRIQTRFPEPVRARLEDILARRRNRSRPEKPPRPAKKVGPKLEKANVHRVPAKRTFQPGDITEVIENILPVPVRANKEDIFARRFAQQQSVDVPLYLQLQRLGLLPSDDEEEYD